MYVLRAEGERRVICWSLLRTVSSFWMGFGMRGVGWFFASALHEELEHEAAHLAGVSVVGGVVVGDGDVAGALEEAVEVVGVEGYFVVDGGEVVCLAYGVGYERGVVDAFGHVAFVAGEEEEVVEVDVARLEHAHYLHAYNGLAVEWYGGGGDELGDESAQRGVVDEEVAAVG